jgi:hypothetical protein
MKFRCAGQTAARIFTCRGLDKGRVTDTHAKSAFVSTTEGDHLSGCRLQPIGELPVPQSKQFAISLYGTPSPPCDHTSSLPAEESLFLLILTILRISSCFLPRFSDLPRLQWPNFCPSSKKIANLCAQPLPTPPICHSFDESDTCPRFYELEHTQWRRSRLYCSAKVAQGTTMDHKRPTLQRSVGMRRIRA